jgi:anthranilate phosphoribosyltransferase
VAEDVGISFCFAPAFHPALRHAAVARKELAVATVFNFLGPLANPGSPAAQAIGCADPRMAPIMAGVFARRGVDAWVFRGDDGLDELTTTTTSRIWLVTGGAVVEAQIDPTELGLPLSRPGDLRGGDAEHNADVVRRVLAGEPGPVRDAVLLNAAAAIAVHSGDDGPLVGQLETGLGRAREAVDSGAAEQALSRWASAGAALA